MDEQKKRGNLKREKVYRATLIDSNPLFFLNPFFFFPHNQSYIFKFAIYKINPFSTVADDRKKRTKQGREK